MTPEFTPRIPTTRKANLPPGFAYPIGSGPISDAFFDLPQLAQFTISLSNQTPLLRPPLLVAGFPVLRLIYSNYPQYVPRNVDAANSAKTFGGERWHVEILPTHTDQRPIVQQALLESGILLLKSWLLGPDAPVSGQKERRIVELWYFFDTATWKLNVVTPPTENAPSAPRD